MPDDSIAAPVTDTLQTLPRKIALLGTASTSVGDAPYDDPTWQIWNISANFLHKKRFTTWFELHSPEVLEAAKTVPQYFEFCGKLGNQLIAGHPSPQYWPNARIFPLQEVMDRFGDYFTSSLSYMLAFALHLHLKDIESGGPGLEAIGLWGADMAQAGEYAHQRPCVEYYLGIARGMGIPLAIAPESPLLRCPAKYAFEYLKLSREMTERALESARETDQLRVASLEAEKKYMYAKGVSDAVRNINQYWNL